MNRWTGLGRLTDDPDVRMTDSGKCVTRFTLAINSKSKDKKYTEYVSCVAWNKTAEAIGEYCGKGDQIYVEGRLHTRTYLKNGEKRYYTYIDVNHMEFGAKRNMQKPTPDSERQPLPETPDYQKYMMGDLPLDEPLTEDDIPF